MHLLKSVSLVEFTARHISSHLLLLLVGVKNTNRNSTLEDKTTCVRLSSVIMYMQFK